MQLAAMQAQPKQATHMQLGLKILNLPCLHAGIMDATRWQHILFEAIPFAT